MGAFCRMNGTKLRVSIVTNHSVALIKRDKLLESPVCFSYLSWIPVSHSLPLIQLSGIVTICFHLAIGLT